MDNADNEQGVPGHGLIAADWGTTNLRGFRIGPDGRVAARCRSAEGILNLPDDDFEKAYGRALGDWLKRWPEAPVLLSGMIGSRQGWHEAPYVACPAGAAEIAAAAVSLKITGGGEVWFVPGLAVRDAAGRPDVMRGEETQIVGALEGATGARRLICLPGTHCKWASVEGDRILGFRTAMTGEVYAAMTGHSILGRLMRGEAHDAAAFDRGLARADQPGGLLHHLFGVRGLGLFGEVPAAALASYLSGLLIGHDVRHGLVAEPGDGPVTLIGTGALTERYGRALEVRGRTAVVVDGADAAARGLWRLGRLIFGR